MRWLAFAGLAGCVFLTEQDRRARTDADGDGFTVLDDCDEGDAEVFPGQEEACNGADDDCDAAIDEGFYPDDDGDGWGDDARLGEACFVDWIRTGGDCDDGDANVKPGAAERCDAKDNGCVEGWTPESELDVVTWVAAEGDTGSVDMSAEFVATDETVTLPPTGTLTVCRGTSDYTVRMVATDAEGLVLEGLAIPMEGDDEDDDGRPVFTGSVHNSTPLAIDGSEWTMTVTGLHLKFGKSTASQPGCGLHAAGGARLDVEDVIVSSCRTVEGEGGGVYLEAMDDVELRKLVVHGGLVPSSGGAGGGAGITVIDSARVGLYDSRIYLNEAGDHGGGLWVGGASDVEVARTSFSDNEGRRGGGGIYVDSGELSLTDVSITNNVATYEAEHGGGGIYTAGKVTCTHSTVTGNSTAQVGGGLRIDGDGTFTADGCVFSGNTPEDVWTNAAETLPDDTFWCASTGCVDQ